MSAGIWVYHRDESGLVTSASIVIEACANEPQPIARDAQGRRVLTHDLAEIVRDAGATLLCRPCAKARGDEEARQARLRALPPWYRAWLVARGIDDWRGSR
jgi:hypothetical protein